MTIILTFFLLLNFNNNPPPGTIKVKHYYVDKTELQNIHWLEYVANKSQELDSTQVYKILPDSSNYWYTLRENRFKPIVLIKQEQAMEYCAWRSKVVSKRFGKNVTYRLPTPTEWKEIAEEIVKTDLKQIEKEFLEVQKKIEKDPESYMLEGRENPKARIYDMFDNVTEMTLEKGVAMGSNNHELTYLKTNLTRLIKYNSTNAYLGFRCVAEISE